MPNKPTPPPDSPPPPPHVHQVKSYQRVGRDRVGYCSCLEEVTRQYDYYQE